MKLIPMKSLPAVLAALTLSLAPAAIGQVNADGTIDTGDAGAKQTLIALESPEAIARRLAWWSDARFGMFIHWGLYAQDGCYWKGKDGKTEHMMRHLQIPIAEYEKIATEFNPMKFDADEWVRIAKSAGMKYMVITAKHHDGFAMYEGHSNDYNIVKRTPWGRDPVKELNDACRRHGLKFGVYYSLGRDWHDPDVPTSVKPDGGRRSNTWDYPDEDKKVFAKYFERKVKPQVRELISQYQPAVIWFDTPEQINRAQSEELIRLIHGIKPDCIINQRVGNRLGDYAVREQEIPSGGEPQPWETCMTLNGHWGYKKDDDKWKPTKTLVRNLVEVTSKGGNFLLNVGPTGEGIIPAPSVERLREVGDWIKVNGEAVYGTTAGPFKQPLPWGFCTKKVSKQETTLYLHVFDWPKDGKLVVPGVSGTVAGASMLKRGWFGKKRAFTQQDGTVTVSLPPAAPGAISTTIVLKVAAPAKAMARN